MSSKIQLPQNLTIHQIEEHFNNLKNQFDEVSDADIIIDAEQVETLDSSGLQSLLMVISNSVDNGKTVSWENVPDILLSSAEKIGINQALNL
jgi:anti-anti-sigma regulatory factor